MIRESLLFGVFSWGNYQPLPELDYVLVFKTSFQGCEACSMDEYDKLFYQVSLVYKKRRRIIVHETKDLNEAIEKGRLLSKQLHLNLKKFWNGNTIGWERHILPGNSGSEADKRKIAT
jgi:hypothetical protein